jgi:adenine-specific DNA-methyltransferase
MTKLAKEALLKPEQLEKLKELFPQAVVDGKVDFVSLKALLGEQIEGSNEKYQFTWNGKQNAIANAQKPSLGTLREDKASSKNFDSTENLYIEGDNLEVLKLLQKTYQGKIKMIYIDPPYNTGNDFVYKDDFKDNVKNYLELTNQKNKSNAETSGRYHTDWLNMMYPRLMLARNLLTDDGVIFISIDDNEQSNLKKICDEIFGEMNFIDILIWRKKYGGGQDSMFFVREHEYVFVYAKSVSVFQLNEKLIDINESDFPNLINNRKAKLMKLEKWGIGAYRSDAPSLYYSIKDPEGKDYYPIAPDGREGRWRKKPENLDKNHVFWKLSKGILTPYEVLYFDEAADQKVKKTRSIFYDFIENGDGTDEVGDLFNNRGLFPYPKPTKLITEFIKLGTIENTYILDFFSGSGTTAHAVMKLNAEDGGNRKFIMVQLPEQTEEDSEAYKAGYQNICEIGKERIRRAGEKVKQEILEKDSSADVSKLDVGFKVFKLDSTNIKPWDGTQDINQMLLEASSNVVKTDRTDLDVVHELMLMYGVFNEVVEEIKINGKTLYSIGEHFLMVCLFKSITKQDIEAIIKLKPKNVIFNDAGFENDNVKINAELTLKNHGVEDIKSL